MTLSHVICPSTCPRTGDRCGDE